MFHEKGFTGELEDVLVGARRQIRELWAEEEVTQLPSPSMAPRQYEPFGDATMAHRSSLPTYHINFLWSVLFSECTRQNFQRNVLSGANGFVNFGAPSFCDLALIGNTAPQLDPAATQAVP